MSYATLANILEQLAEPDLISLTDDAQTGEVNEAVVAWALNGADSMIDAHCHGRYRVPFNPVPKLATKYAADLAIYNLYARRTHVEVPEVVKDRNTQALAYLKRVQTGDASMGLDAAPVTVATESQSGLMPGNERIFTRDKMRGL
jgi:phage gp36-like protein